MSEQDGVEDEASEERPEPLPAKMHKWAKMREEGLSARSGKPGEERARNNIKGQVAATRMWIEDVQNLQGYAFDLMQENKKLLAEVEAGRASIAHVSKLQEQYATLVASRDQARRDRDDALETIAKLEGANDSLSWVIERLTPYMDEPE